MEPAHKTLTLTVPNGVLKKNHHHHHNHHQQQQVRAAVAVYRECLKNHAASLGGHAVDGCGEFMASPSSNPSDPTSLTCAACGCHRNFHRRLPLNHHLHPHPLSSEKQHKNNDEEDDGEDDDDDDGQDQDQEPDEIDDANEGETGENSSAPHMLLALSAGVSTHPQPQPQAQGDIHRRIIEQNQTQNGNREAPPHHQPPNPPPVPIIISSNSRKRFRTKFSPEQKERMQDLSERLGWKMQKRDEGLVEERCREIGIGKGVFKVWMHNNKHNFLHSSSRNNFTTTSTTAAAPTVSVPVDGVAPTIPTLVPAAAAVAMSDESDGNGNGSGMGIGVRINGSTSAVS